MQVLIKVLEGGQVPVYKHSTDACCDLYAAEDVNIDYGRTQIVDTAIQVAIPIGYYCEVKPRSGNSAAGHQVQLGTIDAPYRGNIGVICYNAGTSVWTIKKGDRIAQLCLKKVETIDWVEVTTLPSSERGEAGFGSTGI
jgi:dUTP pyrophosphatase